MTTAAASDPFESIANAARYVPRRACERVLEAVELALARGPGPVAITGPAGLGKSMLLSVLAERVAGRYRVVRLPYPALSAAELCRWVLESLGGSSPGGEEDAEGVLLDRAFRESAAGREVLLLVDDASSLPPRTARSLATLVSASGGAIRAVVAAVDDARLGAALAALGATAREIRFDEPMSADETTAYLQARLAGSGERSARFDADTRARIYGATGGVPRRVHELGSAIWRSPDGTDLAALVERWVRGDEDREAEPPREALEIDVGPPVLEIGADEPGDLDDLADLAPPPDAPEPDLPPGGPEPERPLPPDPGPQGAPPARRVRGLVLALLALAVLVVALAEALPRLQEWLEASLPEPPAAAGARSDTSRAAPPATIPELTPPAESDTAGEPPREAGPSDGETGGGLAAESPGGAAATGSESSVAEPEPPAGGAPAEALAPEAESGATSSPPGAEPSTTASPPTAEPMEPGAATETETPAVEPEATAPEPEATAPEPQAIEPAVEPQGVAPEAGPAPPVPAPPKAGEAPVATPEVEAPGAAAEPADAVAPPPPAPVRRRPRGIDVQVTARPPAVIHVDGGRVGTTPLPALDLSPGLHVFRAEFASGHAVVRAVEISAAHHRVHFEPSPEPGGASDEAEPVPDAAP